MEMILIISLPYTDCHKYNRFHMLVLLYIGCYKYKLYVHKL